MNVEVIVTLSRTGVQIPPPPPPFAKATGGKPPVEIAEGVPLSLLTFVALREVGWRRGTWRAVEILGGSFLYYVYIIRSVSHPGERYIGMTDDVDRRLKKHNEGGSPHTSKYNPWVLETLVGFSTKTKAAAFEQYLKTGSGFAFASKHF